MSLSFIELVDTFAATDKLQAIKLPMQNFLTVFLLYSYIYHSFGYILGPSIDSVVFATPVIPLTYVAIKLMLRVVPAMTG